MTMIPPFVNAVPFDEAILCQDFGMVTQRTVTGHCGFCQSSATMPLKPALEHTDATIVT